MLFGVFSLFLFLKLSDLSAKTIHIYGWELPSFPEKGQNTSPAYLEDEAILGRMTCPALTRVSLKKKKSETLLLKKITTSPSKDKDSVWKYQWVFYLKEGLFWWSGDVVHSKDLARFIHSQIPKLWKRKLLSQVKLPQFKVQSKKNEVRVLWKQQPRFGPYLFNGVPFLGSLRQEKL